MNDYKLCINLLGRLKRENGLEVLRLHWLTRAMKIVGYLVLWSRFQLETPWIQFRHVTSEQNFSIKSSDLRLRVNWRYWSKCWRIKAIDVWRKTNVSDVLHCPLSAYSGSLEPGTVWYDAFVGSVQMEEYLLLRSYILC
jgi:hypothetical protein